MRAVIEGLQALRGIAQVSAVTIVAELGQISRFARARQLMGYSGAVSSEDSSGERSEEHTSELQSLTNLVCRLLLEIKKSSSPSIKLRKYCTQVITTILVYVRCM